MFDVQFFFELFPIMFKYLGVTVYVSLAALVLAFLIALEMAVTIEMRTPVLSQIAKVWKSVFRGTPLDRKSVV